MNVFPLPAWEEPTWSDHEGKPASPSVQVFLSQCNDAGSQAVSTASIH